VDATTEENRVPRFVVLEHRVPAGYQRRHLGAVEIPSAGQENVGDHSDWMFEIGGTLRTWATRPISKFSEPLEACAEPLADHRLAYLDYEGEISGGRGYVRRVLEGNYRVPGDAGGRGEVSGEVFIAELSWTEGERVRFARVSFYRSRPERSSEPTTCAVWRLRFSPCW